MAVIIFDPDLFRQQFPEFSDDTLYPDAMLQMYFDMATCYISNDDSSTWWYCADLTGVCLALALNFMTAHLTKLSIKTNAGKTNGIVQSATIDKVTVSYTPPPIPNQWQWWLNSTEYGKELLALLQRQAAGGWYIGGLPETAAFRRVGGIFI